MEVVKALQTFTERAAWEALSASPYSPGPVEIDETLARNVFSPQWDSKERKPQPTVFDEAANKGLSVDRLKHARLAYISKRAEAYAASAHRPGKPPRLLEGVVWLRAGRVRELEHFGAQSFGVYDTGLKDHPAHADVCFLIAPDQGKHAWRSKRLDLYKQLVVQPEAQSTGAPFLG